MPQLDVTDVLGDLDYMEHDLFCIRSAQTIPPATGMAVNTSVVQAPIRFAGVVTAVDGEKLKRGPDAERIEGSILICTKFPLIDGKIGFTADIVKRGFRSYTVVDVNNYSRFGLGFVEAICDLLPLQGSNPTVTQLPGGF